jgi:hypothetical protein
MFEQYNYIPACVHSLSPKIPEFPINMFEQYNYIPARVHSLSPKIPEFPINSQCVLSLCRRSHCQHVREQEAHKQSRPWDGEALCELAIFFKNPLPQPVA